MNLANKKREIINGDFDARKNMHLDRRSSDSHNVLYESTLGSSQSYAFIARAYKSKFMLNSTYKRDVNVRLSDLHMCVRMQILNL